MPNGPCCNRLCSAPPPRRGAGHPSTPCAPSSTRSATWSAPAAPGGCCPTTSPQPGTVYWWLAKWAADGNLDRIHDALREQVRVQAGRRPAPSAAVIDSQSVRAADTVPRASRGWDAGKKVNGRKRHLAVEIVRKRPGQSSVEVLPRRWVVERTLCAARRSVVSPA